ncbi:MAG: MAPEG family protein [Pseudomonadota bacterium]
MLITTILSATIAVLLLILSFRVIASRRETETSLGAGDNLRLERRIRAQANLTEYAPIFIILIGLAEMQDDPIWYYPSYPPCLWLAACCTDMRFHFLISRQ